MQKKFLLLVLTLSLTAMTGCGSEATTPAEISVNPSFVVGSLPVDADYDTTLTVANLGGEDLTVSGFTFLHGGLIEIDVETPVTIQGGSSLDIGIRIHVPSSGVFTDTITIETSDANLPSVIVSIVLTTASYERAQAGWAKFETADFEGALIEFNGAIALDAAYGDAFLGKGWSLLKGNQLALAITAFTSAVTNGSINDARAGRAIAYLDDQNQAQAITDVNAVVTITSNIASPYTFSHNNTITEKDLLWVKARAHFLLAQYASAQIVVNVLAPNNTLDPQSPTYTTDLAALIESLRAIV